MKGLSEGHHRGPAGISDKRLVMARGTFEKVTL